MQSIRVVTRAFRPLQDEGSFLLPFAEQIRLRTKDSKS